VCPASAASKSANRIVRDTASGSIATIADTASAKCGAAAAVEQSPSSAMMDQCGVSVAATNQVAISKIDGPEILGAVFLSDDHSDLGA